MKKMFEEFTLGPVRLVNRFVFPPIKLGSGNPDGTVTERQLRFYRQIAVEGPAVVILEPVAVTQEGREHPRQLCVHLPESAKELKKIVEVIHAENRLACLHLNHAGAAANPNVTKLKPKGPSVINCTAQGNESEALNDQEIKAIIDRYKSAARKAGAAGFDLIEVQAGHGYLISQFLNGKLNHREDLYGQDRLRFAREALAAVKEGSPDLPIIIRISGSEMSPDWGISPDDLLSLIKLVEENGVAALHVGMGHACFSPPWYFHHGALPLKPQIDSLSWLRSQTKLPLIVAGRMGRKERIQEVMDHGLADLAALGRPLIADPGLIEKWKRDADEAVIACGYCLQGCLHRLKSGEVLGCNYNPEIGLPPLEPSKKSIKVLIAGGGPAGISAAVYLTRRGHQVALAEKTGRLGGQFELAWKAHGKEAMQAALKGLIHTVKTSGASILLNQTMDVNLVKEFQPDLLVWAAGASQNIPEIPDLQDQHLMTSVEFFSGAKAVHGPRILVIGAGRTGLEIIEKTGQEGHEVVGTKRTDPIGSMMEAITRNLVLMRIDQLPNVTLMPHTAVQAFLPNIVVIEQDGVKMSVESFQTVILASGMLPVPGPDEKIRRLVSQIETIGDADEVRDIFSAVQAGYRLAQKY